MKVLFLEDDDVYRRRLSAALEKRGMEVFGFSNLEDALVAVEEQAFDAALIDLKVDESSGADLLKPLLEKSPECRAVFLSGFGTISAAVELVKLGASDFLSKPSSPEQIVAALLGEDVSDKYKNDVDVPTLDQNEWEYIQKVLRECGGNVTHAAQKLGLHRRSLQRKLQKKPANLA